VKNVQKKGINCCCSALNSPAKTDPLGADRPICKSICRTACKEAN
jgi:hypothetical protein